MRRYKGPCLGCGKPIDRELRPRRQNLCLDCALEKAAHQHRNANAPDAPGVDKRDRYNATFAAQLTAREGPLYDKWVAGMKRSLEDHPSAQVS